MSELTLACREQFNLFTNTIYIPNSKAGIPIHKPIPEDMLEYFKNIPDDCHWLFYKRTATGEYISLVNSLVKAWEYCRKKAGIPDIRLHDLRHIAATDLYEAGNAERKIMDIAGWKTNMLTRYRHKDSLRSAQTTVFGRRYQEAAEPVNFGMAASL